MDHVGEATSLYIVTIPTILESCISCKVVPGLPLTVCMGSSVLVVKWYQVYFLLYWANVLVVKWYQICCLLYGAQSISCKVVPCRFAAYCMEPKVLVVKWYHAGLPLTVWSPKF